MDVHGTVKSSYVSAKDGVTDSRLLEYAWFAEQEVDTWRHRVSHSPGHRLWLWRYGFTSVCADLYDFDSHDPSAFLSELQRYRLYKSLNGQHRYLIDDKLSQYWMLSDYPENRPTAFGLLDGGRVHGIAGSRFDGAPVPVSAWLPDTLREHAPLVCKKLRSKGGKDVVVCDYDDGFVLDGEPVSEATLCEELGQLSGSLVTEYVDQHAYADDLYPGSANTIRVLTLWDDVAEELFVPMAVQRIGNDRSSPVDNCSAGGFTAEIDLETGELGAAAQYPYWDGHLSRYDVHPDTGARIRGTQIPHWDETLRRVKSIARDNTNVPAIGWDVLLDESGVPVVLEANTGTGVQSFQVHRPLLADRRVARLAARHLSSVDPPADSAPERDRPAKSPV